MGAWLAGATVGGIVVKMVDEGSDVGVGADCGVNVATIGVVSGLCSVVVGCGALFDVGCGALLDVGCEIGRASCRERV